MHPSIKQTVYCQVQGFQVREWSLEYHSQHCQSKRHRSRAVRALGMPCFKTFFHFLSYWRALSYGHWSILMHWRAPNLFVTILHHMKTPWLKKALYRISWNFRTWNSNIYVHKFEFLMKTLESEIKNHLWSKIIGR